MKALLQRVAQASVTVDGQMVGHIEHGLLVLLGVQGEDDTCCADKLLHKILNYRIFPDAQGKMNVSVGGAGGSLLIVSQFTLAADTCKGLRPSFSAAADPALAKDLYAYFVAQARVMGANTGVTIETGIFAADMQVALVNDGPVTFLLEST